MRERTVARNYAKALFDLGLEHGEEDRYADVFDALSEMVSGDARIARFLESPKIEATVKESAVRRALEGRVPERFLRFVLVVMRKRRQGLLELMGDEYRTLLDAHSGRLHASVTLAREPDEAMKELLTERLSSMLGQTVVPQITVNPAILGGLVVRFGDRAMDGSLRRQLVSLRRDMMMHGTLPDIPARA